MLAELSTQMTKSTGSRLGGLGWLGRELPGPGVGTPACDEGSKNTEDAQPRVRRHGPRFQRPRHRVGPN